MDKLNLFATLSKVDVAKRLVWGVLTEEVVDQSGEILDYATAKPAFQAWSDEFAKATDGENLGAVREMHGKSCAGKFVEIEYDDVNKRILVCAKVVDDGAWNKVQERCYTGFSIGGSYAKKWRDPGDSKVIRYTPAPTEGSLVDNPCVKSARFTMIKADGVEEEFDLPVLDKYEPTNDEVKALAETLAKAAGKPDRRQDFLVTARADLIAKHAAAPVEPEPVIEPVAKTVDPLTAILDKADKNAPKPYGEVDYADPKGGKYPIDTAAHIRAAWSYVNMPKNAAKLENADQVKAKIVAAWKAKIDPGGPPSAEKAAFITDLIKSGRAPILLKAMETVGLEKGFYTVERVSRLLSHMSDIASGVIWEEAYEQDSDSTLPQGILDLMASTRSYLIDMINEETAEFMQDCERDGGDMIALCAPCMDVDGMEMAAKTGDLLKMHKADAALLEKVGRRMSSADSKHVQAVHDHAQNLGAKCDSGNVDKAEGAGDLAKVASDAKAESERLQGIIDASAVRVEKMLGDRDEIIEKLSKRLEHIERQPEPPRGYLYQVDGNTGETQRRDGVVAKSFSEQLAEYPEGPERAAFLARFGGVRPAPGGDGSR
jgi:hypothetical protein